MLNALIALSKRLFGKGHADAVPPLADEQIEALRLTFKSRYHSFKTLLGANNRVLEAIADIEKALQGVDTFSMMFVHSNTTKVSVNVFRMIGDMENIAPKKYSALKESFLVIQQRIDTILTKKKELHDTRLVIPLDALNSTMVDVAGGKMANLGDIRNRLEMNVPEGFVITAVAHDLFMNHKGVQKEIDRLFQVAGADDERNLDLVSSQCRQVIMAAEIPSRLIEAVTEAYNLIKAKNGGSDVRMAVRSSAYGEDAENSSFAGQYRSELNIVFPRFFHYYKQVVASKYSVQAISYKLNRGFRDEDIAMCVGCLTMIEAVAGGVIYTGNPLDNRDHSIFINSTWGLPKAVVDGNDVCDLFIVGRDESLTILSRDVREKPFHVHCYEDEGCIRTHTDEDKKSQPSLTDEQIHNLADHAVRIEQYYESPQDIEWAIDASGKIFILQSRPLQQLATVLPGNDLNLDRYASSLIIQAGINASPGVACGTVHKVRKKVDILQFPEGAVLVVEQALPTWASLISRASAVVSEQGSFAGHLANVAREFGVPAIFGAKGVMDKVKDGDVVTVAADLGQMYFGCISVLLEWIRPEVKLMLGSPIYQVLQEVSKEIIPLTLLDPDSREFAPENCQTFHDITRFIHEKSVFEMFNFGKDHSFSERSSKQLFYKVPMNWWILNLDDGFRQEIIGKFVKLEDITSIPMLAFWDGFAAIPWDGPPALDGAGMTSIMFRSAMNPALVTGLSSKYADKNYFMVSRNYCTLSTRLGYHFSTMEAMISERSSENYLRFKFKGGAADFERCQGRVNLIRSTLEQYGFYAEVKADTLDARMEGHDMDHMVKHVKILGYLTLHTRQLDMVMHNSAMVAYYLKKFTKDIDSLLLETNYVDNS